MRLFGKKKNKEELKKLELVINRNTLRAEYHCPYCQALLAEDNPRIIERPKENICKRCGKEYE